MLQRLLQNERTRLVISALGLMLFSVLIVGMFAGPMLMQLRWRDLPHGLICCSFPAMGLLLPWAIFMYRFVLGSSTRHLRRQLARYGDPDEIMRRIDTELADRDNVFVMGQKSVYMGSPQPDCLVITPNWLIRLAPGGSAVIRWPDLAWVHKRVIAKSALLSMHRIEHQLGCRTTDGGVWNIETWSELKSDQVVRELQERRPELLIGYRGEWLDLAAQGRDAIEAELQRRREQLAAMTSEQREAWLDAAWEDYQRFPVRIDRQTGQK